MDFQYIMNRRDFLKKAGVGTAALGLVACNPKKGSEIIAEAASNEVDGNVIQRYAGVGLLGYGCMRLDSHKDENGNDVFDQEKVNTMIDIAMAHGINYFDTAPAYLEGQSETLTANALEKYPRESYKIATKCSTQGLSGDEAEKTGREMFKQSFINFRTDYIDYYLMHSLSSRKDFENRFAGLIDMYVEERSKGHIRNLGFSFHGSREGFLGLMDLHEKYHWDFVQIQLNYVDWNRDAAFLYDELDKREIPIVIMEPLLGGRLSNVPAAIAEELKSRDPQSSIASWAFRFVASHPRIMTVLSGMSELEHLQDNIKTFSNFKPCSEEELDFLEGVGERIMKYPIIECTGCQYCMPCPYGIDIPGIFKFYNNEVNSGTYVNSKEQEDYARARRKYLAAYNKAIPTIRQADHCISCGRCAKRCPQHIFIPRQLKRIDDYLEKLKQDTFDA